MIKIISSIIGFFLNVQKHVSQVNGPLSQNLYQTSNNDI